MARKMRYVTIALWLLMFVIPGAAQNEQRQTQTQSTPDFSGTWVLDEHQSYPVSKRTKISSILNLAQRDSEIRMTERWTMDGQNFAREVVLYSDGRGAKNYGYDGHTCNAKTEWKAKTLVTRSKCTYTSRNYVAHYEETVDEWRLSKDGNTLTKRTLSLLWPNDLGASWSKQVYNRVP